MEKPYGGVDDLGLFDPDAVLIDFVAVGGGGVCQHPAEGAEEVPDVVDAAPADGQRAVFLKRPLSLDVFQPGAAMIGGTVGEDGVAEGIGPILYRTGAVGEVSGVV